MTQVKKWSRDDTRKRSVQKEKRRRRELKAIMIILIVLLVLLVVMTPVAGQFLSLPLTLNL